MDKRLKNSVWLLMDFDINRYLMSNAEGRWDGAEKATRHGNLCDIFIATHRELDVIGDVTSYIGYIEDWDKVHEKTQELTGYMDEVIGFPLVGRPDYNALAPKFFEEFVRLAQEALEGVEYG